MAVRNPPSPLWRLWSFVLPYRLRAAAAAGAALACALAASLYAFVVGPLLTAVLVGGTPRFHGVEWDARALAFKLPGLLVAVALLKASAGALQTGWMQSVAQRVLQDIRTHLYGRLLGWPPRALEARHSGELLSRLTADVAQVEFAVSAALTSYVKDGLSVLTLLGVCLAVDARLFLLAFVAMPLAVLPVSRFAKAAKRAARSTQASLGQLSVLTAELLQNLSAVQSYGAEGALLTPFQREQEVYLGAMKRSLFVRGAFTPVLEFLGFLGLALAIAVGARAVGHEPLLAGHLLSFLTAALLMYQPLKSLTGTLSLVSQGLGAAQRLFELEDEPLPSDAGKEAQPLSQALELRCVRLSYDGEKEVLAELNLQVHKGSRVALVGSSGAGKSTVFSLLMGFLEQQEGQVLWDGEDVRAFSRASLRAQVGWVPQEPVLFSGTVRDNLLLGRPAATEVELWAALKSAHAEGFVQALPAGLDEPVGERGGLFSGGQRQRLALARAFLRKPSVLLLDEPTSALDAESEAAVQAGLWALMEGRTTLVIAHRLATVRNADVICVLAGGRVVEHGTHGALAAAGGAYAALLQQGELAAA